MTVGAQAERVRVMTISRAVDLYLGELARQGLKPRTIATYRRQLDRLADMYPWLDVDEIDLTMIRRHLDREATNGKAGGQNSPATIAQKVSVVACFFEWLYHEAYIPADPTSGKLKRPKQLPAEANDNVVTVSGAEVQRMLAACQDWRERLCLHVCAYTGSRRHAVSALRLRDYDGFADPPTLTFREKGGKTITKPVSRKLADLIRTAELAGLWQSGDDYLVPSKGTPRKAERDDRTIWDTVGDVAARAGVVSTVHALRAAFAVHFLEAKPDQLRALKDLMGHARIETTELYLRRLNRQRGMETVVDLDWDTPLDQVLLERARESFESERVTEKEGFEPSIDAGPAAEPNDPIGGGS